MSEVNGKERKRACVAMPAYGHMTAGAAAGLHQASRTMNVAALVNDSSLLAHNMNNLWCWALNKSNREKVDYFAMIHSDIEPELFWLDKLVAELEEKRLDVLGVVAPIKDQRGVTSTALARDDGNNWRVHCRLTMREIYRLPETFTSDDVGRPLLINTGLWVCRFGQEWNPKVHFEINDAIMWDENRRIYHAVNEPEDWFVSRLFHELGLRIGCTRKITLGHRGVMPFGNDKPWGDEYDKAYLDKSAVDVDPAGFPHDVAGWLTEEEGAELTRLAHGKVCLEVGAYAGRSTICLARKARHLGVVDTFDGRGTPEPRDTLGEFSRNLQRYGIRRRFQVLKGESAEVLPNLPPIFDLVFIDGSHDYESVRKDATRAMLLLRPGGDGLLVFHDYERPDDQGVTQVVNELLADGAELCGRVGSLAVIRPAVAESLVPVGG